MNFIEALKNDDILKTTLTENGDLAFKSTGSYCLDFYSLMGGMRHNYLDLNSLFLRAFYEDKVLTLKILLHLRDIKNGLGERNSFRMLLNMYANLEANNIEKVLPLIVKYGRYDDLLVLLNTPVKNEVLNLIEKQLDEDLINNENGKPISLLSKWLPSINTSSHESRNLARIIAHHLNLTHKHYRQMLSKLRKNTIIENNLRLKDYSFSYSQVPSLAMLKYNKAFIRNDKDRFISFLGRVESGVSKINTSTANVGSVAYMQMCNAAPIQEQFQDIYWKNLPRVTTKAKAIVVRDGSASMTWTQTDSLLPSEVATSLAIYCAESLPEPFKDHFITFSDEPQLIKLPEGTLKDKLKFISAFDDYTSTDIEKVYQLILNVAKSGNVKKEDMVEQIIIISDMEFNEGVKNISTFDSFKKSFKELGLQMPQIVYWNVAARDIHFPVTSNELGVKLVSGGSQKILDLVVNNDLKDITPYEFMIHTLELYNEVDDLLK